MRRRRKVRGELQQLRLVEVRRDHRAGAQQSGVGHEVGNTVGVGDVTEPASEVRCELHLIRVVSGEVDRERREDEIVVVHQRVGR